MIDVEIDVRALSWNRKLLYFDGVTSKRFSLVTFPNI